MYDIDKYREFTSTSGYLAAFRRLKQEIIQTPTLLGVAAELKKLQAQVALTKDPDAPWSAQNRQPVEGLLVIGASGTGKSFATEIGASLLPSVQLPNGESYDAKPLRVETPAWASTTALAKEIIGRTGTPMAREPKPEDASAKVCGALVRSKLTLLDINDLSRVLSPEFHNARSFARESHLAWAHVTAALDEPRWPTPIVITALPNVLDTFQVRDPDPEKQRTRREALRRLNIYRVPDLTIDEDAEVLEGIVEHYCKLLGVRSLLAPADEIGARLLHASSYAFGTAVVLAQKAVALASVRPRGKLKIDDFSATYTMKRSSGSDANVFAAANWHEIDPDKASPRDFKEARYRTSQDGEEWS